MANQTKIGWIGLGKMGSLMAARLVAAEYPVAVYNRTASKTEPLTAAGATAADSVTALAKGSEIIVSLTSDDAALRDVALGDAGVLANAAKGSIFIDMSTVSPAVSTEVAVAAAAAEIEFLRAPVNGSVMQAENGILIILASGPKSTFDACMPVFEILGGKIFHLGAAEEARYMKLAINMMLGITSSMFGEAVIFGKAAGLDLDQMIDIIGESAAGSPYCQFRGPALKRWDFTPTFTTTQMAKDFDLVLGAASANGAPTPLTEMVRGFWSEMIAGGKAEMDFLSYAQHLDEQRKS